MIIDTHVHISHIAFDNSFPFLRAGPSGTEFCAGITRSKLVEEMKKANICACIEPGISIESNKDVLELWESFPDFFFPAIGIHPTRTFVFRSKGRNEKRLYWKQRKELSQFADHPGVVAIGETGLDYHQKRKHQHKIRQKAWFIWQLRLAHKKRLPVILHIRDADKEALRILCVFRRWLHGGVAHCFSRDINTARKYISLGLKIGIGGSLISHGSWLASLEDTVQKIPLKNILLETDSPFVKPNCTSISRNQLRKARNTSLTLPPCN